MKKTLLLGVTAGAMVMFSGCATIMSGETQQVSVNSNVPNLKFQMNGAMYQTPAVLTLRRGNDKILRVTDKKCQKTQVLKRKINPWFFGNIAFIFNAPFSSTTDSVKGTMWKYDDNVNINCVTK